MGFNSISLRKATRALLASAAIISVSMIGGAASAQLTTEQQQSAASLATTIATAVQAAVQANQGASADAVSTAVQAAINKAIQDSGADPQVANAALAGAVTQIATLGLNDTPGVTAGVQAQQQVVLAAAITAAVQAAVAANQGASEDQVQAAVEAAITSTITVSGAPPAVAQLALTGAGSNLASLGLTNVPGVQTAFNNVQTVVLAQAGGPTGPTGQITPTEQPNTNTPTTPNYVG